MSAAEIYDNVDDDIVELLAPADSDHADFTVHDVASADWAVRVIARHERHFAAYEAAALRVIDIAQARIDHEREGIEDEKQRLATSTAYLRSLLEGWHRSILDADPKAKTVRLPAGHLVARKAPDVVDIIDVDGFKAWAEVNAPDLLRTTVAPDKPAIKKLAHVDGRVVDDAGEVVPGVEWVEGAVAFKVDIKADQ